MTLRGMILPQGRPAASVALDSPKRERTTADPLAGGSSQRTPGQWHLLLSYILSPSRAPPTSGSPHATGTTRVPYPGCYTTSTRARCPKSPGLRLTGNPPSMHGAPGEHRPRRGLKIHALLLYYVCTDGQHLSHRKRGGCCPFFRWPPGACTRVSTAYSSIGRGGCCLFFSFWPPWPNSPPVSTLL